jgi:hypothetical protein
MPPPPQDWTQPLVWLVGAILVAGIAAGSFIADARSPSYALGSELVYRLEIGAVVVAALLFLLTTLRLASYGRTFTSFGAGPITTEAGDPASDMTAAVARVEEVGVKMDAMATEVAMLAERIAAVEMRQEPQG